jgi:TrmH family RNA methyltransferase
VDAARRQGYTARQNMFLEATMKPKPLTSTKNARVKKARRLHARRHRDKSRRFLAEGPHLIEAALDANAPLCSVFCTAEFLNREPALADRLTGCTAPVWQVPEDVMAVLADTEQPQGAVAVVEMPPDTARPAVSPSLLALVLDGVSDPGNLGAALRAARAFGATVVLLGPGCCDRFNAKAVRASAGALFSVDSRSVEDLAAELGALQDAGARLWASAARAERPCWAADLTGPTVLVVGSEAHGVSEPVAAQADGCIAIPMPGGGESLNAGVAAGILLYETRRQREKTSGPDA